jgi:dTDP-4-dehydrorhamnose 3,5-epimerase
MTLNYAAIHGKIKCVLYDDRPGSSTRGCVQEFFLSPENYCLLTVPPLIWNGWKGLGQDSSIVVNCATIPHDPDEIERKSPSNKDIPYDWEIQHK